jgi:hypothetical protein
MNKFQLKSQFSESTMKAGFQLKHISMNVFRNECKFGVIEAYWSKFYKLIYIAFKLLNILPMYNKKPLISSFI